MLDKILEQMVDKELVRKGIIDLERDNGVFLISMNEGCISILPNGRNWRVGYNSSLSPEMIEKVCCKGNGIIDEWYKKFLDTKKEILGYTQVPIFDATLSFEEAYEVTLFILSKIQPKWYNPNKMIN